jgi:hypothetical protein
MTLQVESSGADPRDPKTWKPRGAASATTTVEATVAQRAEIHATYRERNQKYGAAALHELLAKNPEFIREVLVREAVIQLMHEGRFAARAPHRPLGRSNQVLVYGLALVTYVDDRVARTGESQNAVFQELDEKGFASLGYEGIRALYRRTKNDDRLKPYLILG